MMVFRWGVAMAKWDGIARVQEADGGHPPGAAADPPPGAAVDPPPGAAVDPPPGARG